jgi:hypothetical protein
MNLSIRYYSDIEFLWVFELSAFSSKSLRQGFSPGRQSGGPAVLLDMAVTINMILPQRAIFALGDDLRTRANALYMATIFSAGAIGSASR